MRGSGFAITAAAATSVDLISKRAAVDWLSELPFGVVVTPFLNLRLSFNSGIAFSLLPATTSEAALSLVLLAGVLVLVVIWLGLRTASGDVERASYALIAGGAVGNMIDRARDGVVTDFLDFHASGWHWPSFNLADVAIVGGVIVLMASSMRRSPRHS